MCLYLVHFPEPYLSASCSSFLEAKCMCPQQWRSSVEDFRLGWLPPDGAVWPSVVFRSTCPPPSAGRWAGLANPSSQTPVLASGRLSPSTACQETGGGRGGRAGRAGRVSRHLQEASLAGAASQSSSPPPPGSPATVSPHPSSPNSPHPALCPQADWSTRPNTAHVKELSTLV